MNLTEKAIAKIEAGKSRAHYYDDKEPSFGLRVELNGRKSFFWYRKIKGTPRFRALGEFPLVNVNEARTKATAWSGIAAKWKDSRYEGTDPFEKKKRAEPAKPVAAPTFRELVEAYIVNHVRPNANRPADAEYDVRWIVKKRFSGIKGKKDKDEPIPSWLDRKIDEIGVEDVLAVKNRCGEKRHSANRAVEIIRTLFNWSSDTTDSKVNFWKVANPADDVESWPEKPRTRFLQPDELLRFNDCLQSEAHIDLKDFLTLAITTGARRSDIFSARWEDVKWERLIWEVPFPKNGESYNVQLIPVAFDVLKRRRAEIPDGQAYVFPGRGKTGHLTDLKKPWISFRKRARLTDFRMHDIRRTNGSYAAIAGVPLQQIGAQLGHKSMQATQVYARLLDDAVRAGRETGQAKMLEMMKAAKKRAKLTSPKQKQLAAVSHHG